MREGGVARTPRIIVSAFALAVVLTSTAFVVHDRSSATAATLPAVSLPKTMVNQVEGNSGTSTVTLTASLNQSSTSTVTVHYATADMTAKVADNDYVAKSGTLTFSPGVTTQPITVQVVGDTVLEDYQTFKVTLSSAVNATLGNANEQIQILNDDKPKMTMTNVKSVVEGQPAVFKPHLLQRYYQPITLNAHTIDGTAKAPGDYTAINQNVTFPAGSKTPVSTSVQTVADGVTEGAENFSLSVSGSGVVAGVTRTATIVAQICTAATPPAHYQHVIIVVMENKNYGQVIGNVGAPWTTALSKSCASANHYADVASPSRPNYIAMTSGGTFGCEGSDADPPGNCTPPSPSLFKQVLDSGGTVLSYAESMTSNCQTTSSGEYAVKHNPWPYYSAEASLCQQFNKPMPASIDVNNLPTLMYIAPNLCNDTHDCGVATGDQWLQSHLQPVLDSAAYQSGSTAVILTYDEYTSLPNVFAAQSVNPGTVVTANTDHYGLLRTIEDMLGLSSLGQAATATSLRSAMHM
jgi:Calx-beta domain-containing protein/phosphoesterase family protein